MSKTPFFIRIARPTYGRYLRRRYRIATEGMALLPDLDGPFLILANHSHVLDPFFISSVFPVHIRWVAGAYLFKNRVIRTVLGRWIGGISKQQGRSDVQTIRTMSAAFKRGEVVGLFPEGTRTWDGEPFELDKSTAKLVLLFGVPVVVINLEGAYALKPRWARRSRSGSLTVRVVRTLTPEETMVMKPDELMHLLGPLLGFSHSQWQRRSRKPFISSDQAEGLEQLLYLCPSCKGRSTILTRRNVIGCTQCGMRHTLDPYDNLVPADPHRVIEGIPAWHSWERAQLADIAFHATDGQPLFPPDPGVLLQRGIGRRLLTLSKRFALTLEPSGMVVSFPRRVKSGLLAGLDSIIFDFNRIQSMIINAKSTVEFYADDQLWRIRIDRHRSILKYVELFTDRKSASARLSKEDIV